MSRINIDFVQDLLSALRLNDRAPSARGAGAPARRLEQACGKLSRPSGEAARIAAAAEALAGRIPASLRRSPVNDIANSKPRRV